MTITETGNNSIDSLLSGNSWLPSAATATGTAVTTVTYSFMSTAALSDPQISFEAMTARQQQATETELATWAAVANVTFVQVASGTGEVQFGTADLGTGSSGQTDWHYSSGTGLFDTNYVYLNNDENYANRQASSFNLVFTPGSYAPSVLIHEIGHALGLKHPGDYGSGDDPPYLPASTDNRDYSVMSYNNGTAYNDYYQQFSGNVYSVTPMLYDIQAMQYLYGANTAYNAGNTTYRFTDFSAPQAIWDGGGINTVDFSACSGPTIINLNAGQFSSTYDLNGFGSNNVAIAYGATIQNAIAGAGGSTIYCNSSADTITGGAGNDTIYLSTGTAAIDGKGGVNTVIVSGVSNLSGDSFANIQSLNLDNYTTYLTVAEYNQLSSALVNPSSLSITDSGSLTAIPSVSYYVLAANDTLTIPAGPTDTVTPTDATDTIQLQGNAGDYTLLTPAGLANGSLQDSQTGTTLNLYGVATLRFADVTVSTSDPAYMFAASQNVDREDIGFTSLFHYGTSSQTTDNVVGEESANLGSGYSAVVLSGARSQYDVSVDSTGNVLTIDDTASGKSYTVTGDHYLVFDKGASSSNAGFQDIDFVLHGSDAQIAALYNAVLGRLPDLAGLEYYAVPIAQGTLSLHQAAVYFLASPEFESHFAAAAQPADDGGPNDQAFITQLYQNVLHRTPSAAETAFYVSDLQGTLVGVAQQDRAQLLVNFALSPENQKDISGWLI